MPRKQKGTWTKHTRLPVFLNPQKSKIHHKSLPNPPLLSHIYPTTQTEHYTLSHYHKYFPIKLESKIGPFSETKQKRKRAYLGFIKMAEDPPQISVRESSLIKTLFMKTKRQLCLKQSRRSRISSRRTVQTNLLRLALQPIIRPGICQTNTQRETERERDREWRLIVCVCVCLWDSVVGKTTSTNRPWLKAFGL
jgi:hypothetical protein